MNTKQATEAMKAHGLNYVSYDFASFAYGNGRSTATRSFRVNIRIGEPHLKKKNRIPAYIFSSLKRSLKS